MADTGGDEKRVRVAFLSHPRSSIISCEELALLDKTKTSIAGGVL